MRVGSGAELLQFTIRLNPRIAHRIIWHGGAAEIHELLKSARGGGEANRFNLRIVYIDEFVVRHAEDSPDMV